MSALRRFGAVHASLCAAAVRAGLVGILVSGCGGDDDPSPAGPQADAGAEAADAPETGPDASDAPDAPDDVARDSASDSDAGDGATGGVVLEEYEGACAMLNACLGIVGQGECMRRAYVAELASPDEARYYFALQSLAFGAGAPPGTIYFPEVIACAKTANDCADLYACLGPGNACNPATTSPSCDNDVLRNCVSTGTAGVAVETDCASHGLKCVTAPGGGPILCGEGFCDPGSYSSNCVGDIGYNCVGAGLIAKDCAALFPGTTCLAVDVSGQQVAQCLGDGQPCDDSFKPSCEGVDLKVCQSGFEYLRSCPPGLPCQVDPNTNVASCGAMVTAGCAPETCEGASLTYCLDGQPRTLDCASLGFSGCEADDVFQQARCVP